MISHSNALRALLYFRNSGNRRCNGAAVQAAATFVIVNGDGPGEGFNDPTPAAPIGGNSGTTVGQQRLNAFQYAANIWGARLTSSVPIRVRGRVEPADLQRRRRGPRLGRPHRCIPQLHRRAGRRHVVSPSRWPMPCMGAISIPPTTTFRQPSTATGALRDAAPPRAGTTGWTGTPRPAVSTSSRCFCMSSDMGSGFLTFVNLSSGAKLAVSTTPICVSWNTTAPPRPVIRP